ncbi:MAG: hypothetical protein AAGB31_10255 [Bdellovibrio sp.]
MRRIVFVLALILFSALAQAQSPDKKKAVDFYASSGKLLTKAQGEKTLSLKLSHLAALEKEFKTTLDLFKKNFPKEAPPQESEISLLYASLEPVFEWTQSNSLSAEDCDKKRQFIISGDRLGNLEPAPLLQHTQEALKWVDELCKKPTPLQTRP